MTGSKMTSVAHKGRSGICASTDVLFVGGIPRGATQGDLRTFFKEMTGDIKKVRFVIDRATRSHRGYGFARFNSEESAMKMLDLAKDGLVFRGHTLKIGCSEPGANSDSGSSGPMGESEDMSDLPELEEDIEIEPVVQQQSFQQSQPVVQQQMQLQLQPQQQQQPQAPMAYFQYCAPQYVPVFVQQQYQQPMMFVVQ